MSIEEGCSKVGFTFAEIIPSHASTGTIEQYISDTARQAFEQWLQLMHEKISSLRVTQSMRYVTSLLHVY